MLKSRHRVSATIFMVTFAVTALLLTLFALNWTSQLSRSVGYYDFPTVLTRGWPLPFMELHQVGMFSSSWQYNLFGAVLDIIFISVIAVITAFALSQGQVAFASIALILVALVIFIPIVQQQTGVPAAAVSIRTNTITTSTSASSSQSQTFTSQSTFESSSTTTSTVSTTSYPYTPPFNVGFQVINPSTDLVNHCFTDQTAADDPNCYFLSVGYTGTRYTVTYTTQFVEPNQVPSIEDFANAGCDVSPLQASDKGSWESVSASLGITVDQLKARTAQTVDDGINGWNQAFAIAGRPNYIQFVNVHDAQADVTIYITRLAACTTGWATTNYVALVANDKQGDTTVNRLLGTVAHEFGHVLGLGHTPYGLSDLMGNGNDFTTLDLLAVTYAFDLARQNAPAFTSATLLIAKSDFRTIYRLYDPNTCSIGSYGSGPPCPIA